MAKIKLAKIHAILGRSHRTGRWRLSPKTSVIALLGSCRLDLRDAQLDGEISKMTATVVLGGVTIIIPPGVEVRPSGLSLLGGASVDVPPFDDDEATTLIEIEWTSLFGRLRIGAEPEAEEVDEPAPESAEPVDAPKAVTRVSAPKPQPAEEPAPAIGFEDLDASPAGIGFDDLEQTTPEPEAAPAIGFDDLDEPAAAVGFEDLDEPTPEPEPAAAVGFEDLDEPKPEATPEPEPEPTPAVGFEDLDEPPAVEEEPAETPNRRSDDPQPPPDTDTAGAEAQAQAEDEDEDAAGEIDGAAADGAAEADNTAEDPAVETGDDVDEASETGSDDEPTPAAVGFEDL